VSKLIIAGGQNIGCAIFDFLQTQRTHQVVGIIARADDKGEDGMFPSLVKRARAAGVPIIQPEKSNTPEVLGFIRESGADFLLSAMYNLIFKTDIIGYFEPRLGIVNIHYAPLPRYCGYWPEMWAIWNEEKDFAISFHYINDGIDTGGILYQPKVEIADTDTRQSLYEKCDAIAFETFKAHYDEFLTARQATKSQNATEKTYYKRGLPHNGIIDPNWDYATITRFIRATSFYPFIGAKFQVGDKIYSIVDKDLEFFKPHRVE
jgi:methionyl-tRNA formyltransferase